MSIGFWIVLAVVLFAVGNLMAVKPSIYEARLDKLRSLARRQALNPKLVPTPTWLSSHDGKTAMIAQYSKINDAWRLPALSFLQTPEGWQSLDKPNSQNPPPPPNAHICAIMLKSNSVSVFWHDEQFIRQFDSRSDTDFFISEQIDKLDDYLELIAKHYQPVKG